MASIVGAPDNSTVKVFPSSDGKSVYVHIEADGLYAERKIGRDSRDNVFIKNEYIEIDDGGKGLGSEIFGRQVEQAREMGVDYISAHAARLNSQGDATFNGYYTWPRMGYDQEISKLDEIQQDEIRSKFPDAKSVLDIMETQEGRDWWKKNGFDLHHAKFDLKDGSRSMKVHEAYMKERESKKKSISKISKRNKDSEKREEPDLNAEDELALDAVWKKIEKVGFDGLN